MTITLSKTYRKRRHSVSLLHGHLVFVTKYRRRVIMARVFGRLRRPAFYGSLGHPSTSRRPSALTPTAMITATETMRVDSLSKRRGAKAPERLAGRRMAQGRYRHLAFEGREQIAIWRLEDVSRAEMARRLSRSG